ncbi:XRE family transcriptional regulator [Actinomadura sp. KC216]|uniref:helix-turn-helix domain-containing protein n=1 Tax=Actinomadura sp. KC216 TaxID=2530370 RepID=UPI001050EA05|nr:helix-turn-helix transcriptional regulator [Actinomadura sp. KC216]TDB86438.1 XRE family transcriptional regulator [Actinomadura sp. KC216]
MTRISPTLRQRRLGMVLRELRAEDGRTAAEVAAALGWTRQKVMRLEAAPRKPIVAEVIKLLDAYGVEDPRREEILQLVSQARERGWWDTYRTQISRDYDAYIGLEAEAVSLRTYELSNIPGLLQTAGYARALITGRRPGLDPADVDARVRVRTGRQEHLLTGPSPVHVWAVIGEGAVRREVGGRAVLREQLEHLLKMMELPNVILQILPFSAGAAPAKGPFVVIDFAERSDPEVVYLETPGGAMWIEDPEQVGQFLRDHVQLIDTSLTEDHTRRLIARLVGELPR